MFSHSSGSEDNAEEPEGQVQDKRQADTEGLCDQLS